MPTNILHTPAKPHLQIQEALEHYWLPLIFPYLITHIEKQT